MTVDSILFLSDAHANPAALKGVISMAEALGPISRRVFLGDAIGYGDDPKGVLDILRTFDVCVKGNHEALVLSEESRWKYSRPAVKTLDRHMGLLDEDDKRFLRTFVPTYREPALLGFHGTPDAVSDYPFNESHIRDILTRFSDADIMIGGHLHMPRLAVFNRRDGEIEFEDPIAPVSTHELDTLHYRYFINCPSTTPGRFGYRQSGGCLLRRSSRDRADVVFLFLPEASDPTSTGPDV
jgi:predicted phosphodiesterase